MTEQQPQPVQQAPVPQPIPQPVQQAPVPQPIPQPVQQSTFPNTISFNTTAPEQTQPEQYPYQSIIEQQQQQIDALMQQNQALNAQVTQMVQGGAQFNQQAQQAQPVQPAGQNMTVQPVQQFPPVYGGNDGMPLSLAADVDVSLESLAKEIGKKPE